MNQAIQESSSEITTKKRTPVVEIIHYLNEKMWTDYKPSTYKTQEIIRARLKEGFTVEDFKKVIDSKTAEWLDNPRMSKYLRPATLFGTKFESYLNQKSTKKTLNEEDFDLDDEADYYTNDSPQKDKMEIILAKHRNGPTGTVELGFNKQFGQFVNVEA